MAYNMTDYNYANHRGYETESYSTDDFLNPSHDEGMYGGRNGGGGRNDSYPPSLTHDDGYQYMTDPYRQHGRPDLDRRRVHERTDSYDRLAGLPSHNTRHEPVYASALNRNMSLLQTPPVIYTLDHLATFIVSQKQRLLTPEDGMHQLRHMESTTGVWTMRVEMRIDQKEIVITETATQKEIESFPISFVSNPVHVQSDNKSDVYNNIVIFTVQSDSNRTTQAEMNLFQCIGVSGQEVVTDITAACTGKFPRPKRRPVEESPRPVDSDQLLLTTSNVRRSQLNESTPPPPVHPRIYDNDSNSHSKSPAVTVQDTELEVEQLNHCFDDIERFVASLQIAANNSAEYEKKKTEGANQTDLDYLQQRAQPPATREFVSIFQKFKFAFNLLPRLKDVLKNPDVNELAKTLFSPFSLILESSKDSGGKYKLANSVVSPLLTRDACKLLDHSLESKDFELWQSIGDSWTVSSEKWTGVPAHDYTPVFGSTTASSGQSKGAETQSNGGTSSRNSAIMDVQQKFLNELKSRHCKISQAQTTRERKSSKEISLVDGEYLEVLNDEKNWWKVSNIRNETGYAPKTVLKLIPGY